MKEFKLDVLNDVPVEMIFEIGRTEKEIKELRQWKKGTTIKLEDSVVNQLNVYVNNQLFARGRVLKDKDGEMSVEITKREG